jgi:hypothetical protein
MTDKVLDPWRDILGLNVDESRRAEVVAAYVSVLDEIKKLRELNLTDIHPSIIFEPTAAYRTRKKK